MKTCEMVDRLNELDRGLCSSFGFSRSGDAATLDEAIAMSGGTTDRLLAYVPSRNAAGSMVELFAAVGKVPS